MLFHNMASNCCNQNPENLPILPVRRFEDIPDETQFEPIPTVPLSESESLQETKNFIRNRLILISVLALFVLYFQMKGK